MAASEKALIILNPVAGHGRSLALRQQVEDRLRKNGVEFETLLTERPGHARELAATAHLNGFRVIAAMGGDGTLSEVINGMFTRYDGRIPEDLKLAAIPSGTGNDFLSGSDISTEWMDAVDALGAPSLRKVDVLEVSDSNGLRRYAANCLGFGYDAYVTGNVTKRGTGRVGPLGYMVEALRGLFVFNPANLKIGVDGAEPSDRERVWLLSVTNSEKYGGGMKVNPGAKIDDGLLNYAMLHGVSRRSLFSLVFLVRSGKHIGKPGVLLGTIASMVVDAPQGFPCHVDGDTVRVTYPVTVRVLAGALPFVVGGTG
ncbi:MAG: diacylglycerol/lipid kinase family protein [Bacillota bacterium]